MDRQSISFREVDEYISQLSSMGSTIGNFHKTIQHLLIINRLDYILNNYILLDHEDNGSVTLGSQTHLFLMTSGV